MLAMLRNFLTKIFSPEILREVTNNGDNLSDLLQQASNEQLEPNCLNEALIAAVQNDHHQNVGKLIVKGASNISEALKLSVNEKKVHASAMLMLVYAAMEGNCNLIRQLFDEIRIEDQPCKECSNSSGGTYALVSRMLNQATSERDSKDCLQSVRRALKTSHMPTTIPIEIARRNITGHTSVQRARRCAHVREELLMKTDMNKEEKYVHWQGLGLRSIEVTWLKRVDWVKTLLIGRNQLRSLPAHIGVHLKQVSKTTSVFLSMFSHVHSYGAGISEICQCLLNVPLLSVAGHEAGDSAQRAGEDPRGPVAAPMSGGTQYLPQHTPGSPQRLGVVPVTHNARPLTQPPQELPRDRRGPLHAPVEHLTQPVPQCAQEHLLLPSTAVPGHLQQPGHTCSAGGDGPPLTTGLPQPQEPQGPPRPSESCPGRRARLHRVPQTEVAEREGVLQDEADVGGSR